MNAIMTATPPPRGNGRRLTRLALGWSTMPRRRTNRRITGVAKRAISAARTNAATMMGIAAPAVGEKLTRRPR